YHHQTIARIAMAIDHIAFGMRLHLSLAHQRVEHDAGEPTEKGVSGKERANALALRVGSTYNGCRPWQTHRWLTPRVPPCAELSGPAASRFEKADVAKKL